MPAWVAESFCEGQRLPEMAGGAVMLAELVTQDAYHEIGVGHIAATFDRAEYVPATRQKGKGIRGLSLLPTYLGEKERGLSFAVRVAEPSAQPESLFETGRGVGQLALPPVGAREPGQAVDLATGVTQLGEDGVAVGEMCQPLR